LYAWNVSLMGRSQREDENEKVEKLSNPLSKINAMSISLENPVSSQAGKGKRKKKGRM